jgi:hypothetical protein
LHCRLEGLLYDHVIGDDNLIGQQAVQLQQQGVRVLLVIRVEGRAQFLDLLLDEAKLWDDGALSVRFDGVQDGGDGDHQWLPFIAGKTGPACQGRSAGGLGLDGARIAHRRVSVSGVVASQAIAGVAMGVGSERAPHAPLGEQRAWAFDDPDAATGLPHHATGR